MALPAVRNDELEWQGVLGVARQNRTGHHAGCSGGVDGSLARHTGERQNDTGHHAGCSSRVDGSLARHTGELTHLFFAYFLISCT